MKKQIKTFLVVFGVLVFMSALLGGGYVVYRLVAKDDDQDTDSSQPSTVSITEINAEDNQGNEVTSISEENEEKLKKLFESAEIVQGECLPIDDSEIENIKAGSEFYIYVKFDKALKVESDIGAYYGELEIPAAYIFGPNEDGDILYILDEESGDWLCYGFMKGEEYDAYEIVFGKDQDTLLSDRKMYIAELSAELTYDGTICKVGDSVNSELAEGEDENSDVGEVYYRIDCEADDVFANAKILINPIVTGGGFGFDALSKGSTEVSINSTAITILGDKYRRVVKTSTGVAEEGKDPNVKPGTKMTYIETYFVPESTIMTEFTPLFQMSGENMQGGKEADMIWGYEVEAPTELLENEEVKELMNQLDGIFTSLVNVN